jgi:ribosomal protein L28
MRKTMMPIKGKIVQKKQQNPSQNCPGQFLFKKTVSGKKPGESHESKGFGNDIGKNRSDSHADTRHRILENIVAFTLFIIEVNLYANEQKEKRNGKDDRIFKIDQNWF